MRVLRLYANAPAVTNSPVARTPVPLPTLPSLYRGGGVVAIGSCFAETIATRLVARNHRVLLNPWGTLFNPISMANAIGMALSGALPSEKMLVERDGQWVSLLHHGKLKAETKEGLLSLIAHQNRLTAGALSEAQLLIITFGTAVVFSHGSRVVANCHKLPADLFSTRMLQPAEIMEAWRPLLTRLLALNPELNIIITVSPVRYRLSGPFPNSLSKANLLLATEGLLNGLKRVHYFPAFEIITHELRDYRHFTDDLMHIAPAAQDYVYSRFLTACQEPFPDRKEEVSPPQPLLPSYIKEPPITTPIETPKLPKINPELPIYLNGSERALRLRDHLGVCGLEVKGVHESPGLLPAGSCLITILETEGPSQRGGELLNRAQNALAKAPDLPHIIMLAPRLYPYESPARPTHIWPRLRHIAERVPNCYYYPAFEILHDELRDYRFYDLPHSPLSASPLAESIIFSRLLNAILAPNDLQRAQQSVKKERAKWHRSGR